MIPILLEESSNQSQEQINPAHDEQSLALIPREIFVGPLQTVL